MRTLLAPFLVILIRLLRHTWRVRLRGCDPDHSRPVIACFWHGHQAGMLAHPRPKPVAVLASLSRDGSLQARVLKRLGFRVVRGSSSRRGAEGLRALLRELAAGSDAAFAVDGPRGPLHKVKPGAVLAAQLSGGAVIPVSVHPSRAWTFVNAWDRYQLPKPFATVEILRGQPIATNGKDTNTVLWELEQALLSLGDTPGASH